MGMILLFVVFFMDRYTSKLSFTRSGSQEYSIKLKELIFMKISIKMGYFCITGK